MSNLPGVNDMLTTGLGTSSTELDELARAQRPGDRRPGRLYPAPRGEGLDQAPVMAAGVLGLSFVLSPAMWINGTQNLRTIAPMPCSPSPLGRRAAQDKFFVWAPTDYAAATLRDPMIRKANDATFRDWSSTPGASRSSGRSPAAQKYGTDIVKAGTDGNARKKVIADRSFER